MSKFRIAWMPGSEINNYVMEAAGIVLNKLKPDAEYVSADIGWEFWRKKANPLSPRTIEILKM